MKYLIILFYLLSSTISYAACTGSSPTWLSTPDYASVNSCLSSATAGDTINVSAGDGSETWSSTLSITKSINLIGPGAGSLTITYSGGSSAINVALSTNRVVRISGFYFDCVAQNRSAITITGSGATDLRIDNNTFNQGRRAIFLGNTARVYGVIDNNTFTNASMSIFYDGPSDYEWNRTTIQAGTANALFIEDNTFTYNNSGAETAPDAVIYVQEGASTVIRYNTFNASSFTNGSYIWINHHGNQSYYPGVDYSFRGQAISEIYNNNVSFHHSYTSPGGLRGGSIIAYNNTVTCVTGCPAHIFNFREEECNQPAFFSPLRTQWPAQDQIFNSFFWNNTYNGSPDTGFQVYSACDSTFIQENRDYFMHAPQSSGGYEYFTGSRKGGSTTAPTTGDTGSMEFSASGANAYYPYTGYTYPHPLRTGDITPPTITNVSSDKANGSYTVGEVIDIDVTFSEQVTSTGNVTITLETGTTDRTCTFTVTNAISGTCNYIVQAGDTSSDLNVNTISGIINDASLNAMVNFTPAVNLSTNKALVIDTTVPVISNPRPTGAQACAGSVTLQVATNETSTCKYDTSYKNYENLIYSFSAVANEHSATQSVTCGSSYTYYVKCRDTALNEDDETITFSVEPGALILNGPKGLAIFSGGIIK